MAVKRKRDSLGSNTLKGVRKTIKVVDDPKVHPLGTTLADLPCDIVTRILLKLSIKSILICKCVCKSWHCIISDPNFARLQFERAPITALVRTDNPKRVSRTLHLLDFDELNSNEGQNLPSDNDCGRVCSCKDSPRPNCDNHHIKLEVKFKLPLRDSKMVVDTMLEARRKGEKKTNIACKPRDDKFDVVNSCNGLLCLCDPVKRNPLVICNPITGEFIRLPQSENNKLMRHLIYSGFGYIQKTNEYKVIRIYMKYIPYLMANEYAVEIHTLGTGLWRNIEYQGPFWTGIRYPTCLNGSLHWLVFDGIKVVSVLCFDLENETFNSFSCPSALSSMTSIGFGEFKGSLYICGLDAYTKYLKFWAMETYGVSQSWTEVLNLDTKNLNYWPCLYQPTDHGILIFDPSGFFIYYDPQKHLFRSFEGRGTSVTLESIFHIPSLIRLKDAVKGDNIEVLNVHSRCATFKLREDKDVLYLAKYKDDHLI